MKISTVAPLACCVVSCALLWNTVRAGAQNAPAAPPKPAAAPVDPKLEAEKAAAVTALKNVKSLSTACLMNAADNGNQFKIQTGTFKADIGSYVLDSGVFTSPLDKSGTASYKFNKELQNVPLAKIKKPGETVMVYEGEWGKPAFRHHGMAVIGFADGHVKMFGPTTAKSLLWKP